MEPSKTTILRSAADGMGDMWECTEHLPFHFHKLRQINQLDSATFSASFSKGKAVQTINGLPISGGRSGSLIYATSDNRFLLKTISVAEHRLLLAIIDEYSNYIEGHTKSLLVSIAQFRSLAFFNLGLNTAHFLCIVGHCVMRCAWCFGKQRVDLEHLFQRRMASHVCLSSFFVIGLP